MEGARGLRGGSCSRTMLPGKLKLKNCGLFTRDPKTTLGLKGLKNGFLEVYRGVREAGIGASDWLSGRNAGVLV